MSRRLNILIVPEEGGNPKRYNLSVFWLKTAAWATGILLLLIIAGAVTYSGLAKRALDFDQLSAENERLTMENTRIIRVAREVDQSRQILAQIIRSLGGHLELGRTVDIDTVMSMADVADRGFITSDDDLLFGNDNYAVERIMAYGLPTCMPVQGFISQEFYQDYLFPEHSHRGIDIAAKSGVPIKAAAAGRVTFSEWTPHFGWCILLVHSNGYITFYGHNQLNLKKVDDEVARGEPIALLGTSGRSSAPHLHFEIWKDGVAVNPIEFIQNISEDSERM
ncbi:M23 family metallopeptidase [bacterium]|nr:M23 family metallopeptidase [bacterium]